MVRVNDRGPYAADRVMDVSVKTAKMLGFYDKGVTRVRVQYVGRAPLKGSSDLKLAATLRHNGALSGVQVASADPEPYDGTYLRSAAADAAAPPRRAGAARAGPMPPAAAEVLHRPTSRSPACGRRHAPTIELAAATRPNRRVSPVSAFAPVRYDGHAGFMGGRGLY